MACLPTFRPTAHPLLCRILILCVSAAGVVGMPVARPAAAADSWISNGPPGNVQALAVDPTDRSTAYAGIRQNGVFKTEDGGASWHRSGVGIPPTADIRAIAVAPSDPSTVYAGSPCCGDRFGSPPVDIYRSTDGGTTWTSTDFRAANLGYLVFALAVDPLDPLTVFAGTGGYEGFVAKTTDGGETWVEAGLPYETRSLAFDPRRPSILYAGTRWHGVYVTQDGGAHWRNGRVGYTAHRHVMAVSTDPTAAGVAYAATDQGVYKTADAGVTWFRTNAGIGRDRVLSVTVAGTDPPTVLVGDASGVLYRSTDGGVTWRAVRFARPSLGSLAASASEPGLVFAGGAGAWRSDDAGRTWEWASDGISGAQVGDVAVARTDPLRVYAAAEGGGVFRSEDGGEHWDPPGEGLPNQETNAVEVDPADPNLVYAGQSSGIARTNDGGLHWTHIDLDVPFSSDAEVFDIAVAPSVPEVVYAAAYGGMFRSDDHGVTWHQVGGSGQLAVVVDPTDPDIVYAAWGDVVKSTDGGKSWYQVFDPPGYGFYDLAIDPTRPNILYGGIWTGVYPHGKIGGVYKSTDGGATWFPARQGIAMQDIMAVAVDPGHPDTIYAGGGEGSKGAWVSQDGGRSWHLSGLASRRVYGLAVDATGTHTYAGTSNGGVYGMGP